MFTNNPVSIVNGSLWTLPLEFTCYLLLLAASWSKALGHRSLGLAVIIGLTLHLSDSFMAGQSIFGISLLHLNRLGVIFSVGALLASLKDKVVYSPAAAVTAVAIILAAWGLGQSDWHRFAVAYLVLMPYVVVTLAWRLQRFHWLDRWDISYGFYLYAFVVQQIVVVEFGSRVSIVSLTLISAFATAVCAAFSWVLLERPVLALKPSSSESGYHSWEKVGEADEGWYPASDPRSIPTLID